MCETCDEWTKAHHDPLWPIVQKQVIDDLDLPVPELAPQSATMVRAWGYRV